MASQKLVITIIWWSFGLIIMGFLFWISANDAVFGSNRSQAIDWILPHLIPTMTLTGAAAYVKGSEPDPAKRNQPAFLLACLASIFYLLVLCFVIVVSVSGAPAESARGITDELMSWNKVLGIFQGLAASAIGVFFVKS